MLYHTFIMAIKITTKLLIYFSNGKEVRVALHFKAAFVIYTLLFEKLKTDNPFLSLSIFSFNTTKFLSGNKYSQKILLSQKVSRNCSISL